MTENASEYQQESAVRTWSPSLSWCFAAMTIGVFLGGGVVHLISPVFAQKLYEPLGLTPTPEQILQYKSSLVQFWTYNHALDFATIGAALGIAIGLFTTQGKRAVSAWIGGVFGLLVGAISGFIASRWAVHAFIANSDQSLIRSICINAIVWGNLSSGILVAIGYVHGLRSLASLGLVGFLSGILASVFYLTVSSLVFPSSDLSYLISHSLAEKVVWAASLSLVLGFGLYASLRRTTQFNPL